MLHGGEKQDKAEKIFRSRTSLIIDQPISYSGIPLPTGDGLYSSPKEVYRPDILESSRSSLPQIFAFRPCQPHPHDSAIFRFHSGIPPPPRTTDDPGFRLDRPLHSSSISPQVQPHFHLLRFLSSLRLLRFSDEIPSLLRLPDLRLAPFSAISFAPHFSTPYFPVP